MKNYFITGTDTNIGKTYCSVLLLEAFNQAGFSTIGLKPIASGSSFNEDGLLRNDDAIRLQNAASITLPYEMVNPICFAPPIAPHIAAAQIQTTLTVAQLKAAITPGLKQVSDVKIIEGAGGWYVPLNSTETVADFVESIAAEIILVVGIRLGCLNHAILTAEAIRNRKLKFAGWIANQIEAPTSTTAAQITTLAHFISVPLIGIVKYQQSSYLSLRGCEALSRGNLSFNRTFFNNN